MADKLTDSLDKLLDKYDERRAEQLKAQQATKKDEDIFLENFSKFRDAVARPLFEGIGNHLRARGHEFELRQEEYGIGADQRTNDANIGLFIYPKGVARGQYRHYEYPHYTVFASRIGKFIRTHASNMRPGGGGVAGPRGEYKLEQLTRQVLEEEVLKVLGEIFRA